VSNASDTKTADDPIDECERVILAQSGLDGLMAVAKFLHALPSDAVLSWGDGEDGMWTPAAFLAMKFEERARERR